MPAPHSQLFDGQYHFGAGCFHLFLSISNWAEMRYPTKQECIFCSQSLLFYLYLFQTLFIPLLNLGAFEAVIFLSWSCYLFMKLLYTLNSYEWGPLKLLSLFRSCYIFPNSVECWYLLSCYLFLKLLSFSNTFECWYLLSCYLFFEAVIFFKHFWMLVHLQLLSFYEAVIFLKLFWMWTFEAVISF